MQNCLRQHSSTELFRLKKKNNHNNSKKNSNIPVFFLGFLELFSLDKPLLPSLPKPSFSALLTHNVSLHKKLLYRNASIPTKVYFWGSDNAQIQNCCCLLSNFTVSHNSLSREGVLTFWFHYIQCCRKKKKACLKTKMIYNNQMYLVLFVSAEICYTVFFE